ncbi:alpha/beta hydrolase [Sphingomonas jatrophae]|uniref:Acetyl esterase/lipase n=1 Tax=Sphingomonas jatrophae TaxID=1166337 RepID=A0A1I6LBA9_9SPHN|nr:alpha/beta hydrolase [Sphingomonas jatrophae]SFS00490.1 Acetyl esterase/lipase [Sphingomonas jatrophae]
MIRRLAAALLAGVPAACSPLGLFATLVPQDRAVRVARDVAYGAGERRRLDVYAPRARGGRARPVIVFFYGGSWASGSRRDYGWVGRALAAQGFVVAVPDYRLVPEGRYPGFVEDGAAAVAYVRGHAAAWGGDGGRILLAGHSAGAYIAAMLAVDPRWLGDGRTAVRGLIGLAGPYDFAPFDVAASRAAFGHWPDAAETQPVSHAGAGDPPALLLSGADDRTVQPRNTQALAARLRAGGVAAEVKLYPGIAHVGILTALARPLRGRAPVLRDMAAFAHRVTAGAAPQATSNGTPEAD